MVTVESFAVTSVTIIGSFVRFFNSGNVDDVEASDEVDDVAGGLVDKDEVPDVVAVDDDGDDDVLSLFLPFRVAS